MDRSCLAENQSANVNGVGEVQMVLAFEKSVNAETWLNMAAI